MNSHSLSFTYLNSQSVISPDLQIFTRRAFFINSRKWIPHFVYVYSLLHFSFILLSLFASVTIHTDWSHIDWISNHRPSLTLFKFLSHSSISVFEFSLTKMLILKFLLVDLFISVLTCRLACFLPYWYLMFKIIIHRTSHMKLPSSCILAHASLSFQIYTLSILAVSIITLFSCPQEPVPRMMTSTRASCCCQRFV